jgi:hypothetical protein
MILAPTEGEGRGYIYVSVFCSPSRGSLSVDL